MKFLTLKKMILCGLALSIATLIYIFFNNEFNRAAFGSWGYIDEGRKFGVTIGDSFDTTRKKLESKGLKLKNLNRARNRGLSPDGLQNCHGISYPDTVRLEAFDDYSWRRGVICVASEKDKVIKVSWTYGMFQP